MKRARSLTVTAFAVEGFVVSAPTIQPSDQRFSSFGGVTVISGNLEQKEPAALAAVARVASGR
jgi:hypothetical protein